MQINDLAYVKAVKSLAQIAASADEARGTFVEDDLRSFHGKMALKIAARYDRAIRDSGARKPAIFVVYDDADYARRKWLTH